MKVLIVEDENGSADEIAHAITDAGHHITTCHDPSAPAFPCDGMGGPCPLEQGVDLVVAVRRSDNQVLSIQEDGARCAARAGIPIVVVGSEENNPYSEWAAATVPLAEASTIVSVIEAVAAAPDARLTETATRALVENLRNAGIDASDATATVRRTTPQSLMINVSIPSMSDTSAARRASVWVASAVRRESKLTGTIDVSTTTATGSVK
jgi:hypothetical protein